MLDSFHFFKFITFYFLGSCLQKLTLLAKELATDVPAVCSQPATSQIKREQLAL